MTEEQDRLSKIIQYLGGRWPPSFHNADSDEVKYYSEETVNKVIAGISIVMAALLLKVPLSLFALSPTFIFDLI